MSDALMYGQRFRTFNLLDDFSREVLAVEVDTNLPAARIIRVLDSLPDEPNNMGLTLNSSNPASLHKTCMWSGSTVPFTKRY